MFGMKYYLISLVHADASLYTYHTGALIQKTNDLIKMCTDSNLISVKLSTLAGLTPKRSEQTFPRSTRTGLLPGSPDAQVSSNHKVSFLNTSLQEE